jgi:hypothetical protein
VPGTEIFFLFSGIIFIVRSLYYGKNSEAPDFYKTEIRYIFGYSISGHFFRRQRDLYYFQMADCACYLRPGTGAGSRNRTD